MYAALRQENSALTNEVAALQAQQLSQHDMTVSAQRAMSARVETLAKQLQSSDIEAQAARDRLELAVHSEAMYQQIVQERNLLEARVATLEGIVRRNDADRQVVARRFESLQRALAGPAPNGGSGGDARSFQVVAAELSEIRRLLEHLALTDDSVRRGAPSVDVSGLRATPHGVVASPGQQGDGQQQGTRIQALERTVHALNAELAATERRLKESVGQCAAAEKAMGTLRGDFERDQHECDQVVAAMAAELEQLMDENSKLRQRLRALTTQHIDGTH
jgi:hypothetical protein